MNTLLAKGCWHFAKGRLKQKLAGWMEDELQFTDGKEDELLGRIEMRKAQRTDRRRRVESGCRHSCK